MWVYEKLLHIPWMAYRTNVSIQEELNIETGIIIWINRNIISYFGQITRGKGVKVDSGMWKTGISYTWADEI